MSSLYELTGKYLQIQAVMEEGDEEYPFELLTVGEDLNLKIENYGRIIRNLEADTNAYADEIKRLTEKMKSAQRGVERMKQAVYDSMKATGRKKVKTDLFDFTIAGKGGLKPLVFDKEVPQEYCKVVYQPDKEKIRKAIEEDGEYLEFAHLEERGEYLRIK